MQPHTLSRSIARPRNSCPMQCPKPHQAPSSDAPTELRPIVRGVSACRGTCASNPFGLQKQVVHSQNGAVESHREVIRAREGVQAAGCQARPGAPSSGLQACQQSKTILKSAQTAHGREKSRPPACAPAARAMEPNLHPADGDDSLVQANAPSAHSRPKPSRFLPSPLLLSCSFNTPGQLAACVHSAAPWSRSVLLRPRPRC